MGLTPEQEAEARARAQQVWRNKPTKPLQHGDHLVFHYALRCKCQRCGRLMDWDSDEGMPQTFGECCGIRYTLTPRSVIVTTEDVSSRPVLPRLEGSDYSDPDFNISDLLEGGAQPS